MVEAALDFSMWVNLSDGGWKSIGKFCLYKADAVLHTTVNLARERFDWCRKCIYFNKVI